MDRQILRVDRRILLMDKRVLPVGKRVLHKWEKSTMSDQASNTIT